MMIVAVSRIPLPKTERYLCWVRVAKQGSDEHIFLQRRFRCAVFALIYNRKAPSWEESQDGAFLLSAHSISANSPATMAAERNRRLYEWKDLSRMNAQG